jgi:hypothetical protein
MSKIIIERENKGSSKWPLYFYCAYCSCGWSGMARERISDAEDDANSHESHCFDESPNDPKKESNA